MKQLTIGHHESDKATALEIQNNLEQVGIDVKLLSSDLPGGEYLFERLQNSTSQSLVLISNAFLKDPNCVYNAFENIKQMMSEGKLISLIVPQFYVQDNKVEKTATKIEKIGDMIKFMNYWQESYLELRKNLRRDDLSLVEKQKLSQDLSVVRPISSEMGELLRLLKINRSFYLEDLRATSYKALFQFLKDNEAYIELKNGLESGRFRATLAEGIILADHTEEQQLDEELEFEVSEIPGMNLLNRNNGSPQDETDQPAPSSVNINSVSETESDESAFDSALENDLAEDPEQMEKEAEHSETNPEEEIHTLNDPTESSSEQIDLKTDEFSDLTEETEPIVLSEIHGDESKLLHKILEENETELEEQLLDMEPNLKGSPLNRESGSVFSDNDEDEFDADDLLQRFIDQENNKFEADYLSKAVELFRNDQREEAYSLIEKGIQETQSGYAAIKWIDFLLESQEEDEAYAFALEALEEDTFNEQLVFKIGLIELERGRVDDAISRFEKVLSLDPDFNEVFYPLASLLAEHRKNNETRILKLLKRAIKSDPQNIEAQYQYALLLLEYFNEEAKGIKGLKKVLKKMPSHLFANYDLALHAHKMGDMESAKAYYIAAVENNEELKTRENDEAFGLSNEDEGTLAAESKVKDEYPLDPSQSRGLVLITGATSGIGKATAYEFAQKNYALIINGRREDRLEEIKTDLVSKFNVPVRTLCFDVRSYEEAERAISSLSDHWADIDILVNNAGLARGLAPIHEGDIEHWDTMIDTNIKGILYMTKLISKQMVNRSKGHIINTCSTAGKESYPNGNVYCATKFAVDALTKGMRLDLYKHGIRVSQVSPAHVEETEFARVRFDQDVERAKIYEDFTPLSSQDVAETIYFIASRPLHVNVQDVLIMGTQQAGSTFVDRSGRKYKD